jgi:hypothetical protein
LSAADIVRFSILHISDLHRDSSDELDNPWLLDSLERELGQYAAQDPPILRPSVCIVSGDLVRGVLPGPEAERQLARQNAQAEECLAGLADRLFQGDRERVVVLPGNHDISYGDFVESTIRIEIPHELDQKERLVHELRTPGSLLRWSWKDLCFFRIVDQERYRGRFRHFAAMFQSFYRGMRTFSLAPEEQFAVFDFPDLGFCVVALNSCHNNDPFRRTGAFNPTSVTAARRALLESKRSGWLIGAAWHHSVSGPPDDDDYIDIAVLQSLIDAGVSLGFHGHQHRTDCLDEHYRIGPGERRMNVLSAGTLCAGPKALPPATPRSYNIVEVDTEAWRGRVHQRRMVNTLYDQPIWGAGHFETTNRPFLDFEVCPPTAPRIATLDATLALERADRLVASREWERAIAVLMPVKDAPLARPLLFKALAELADFPRLLDLLGPPQTAAETVILGGLVLGGGGFDEAAAFLQFEIVRDAVDASVRDISRRVRERWLR